MLHLCHAFNCENPIAPRLFMCRKHWAMLSGRHKEAIYATYVQGQEKTKRPTKAYLCATSEAIIELAESEGFGDAPRLNLNRKILEMFASHNPHTPA